MERPIRPDPRPSRRSRELVAVGLTLLTTLLVVTMAVVAARGGEPADAHRFLYSGMVVMLLSAGSVIAWRWAQRARPPVPLPGDPDPAERHHRGLSGRDDPPVRW